MTTQAAANVQGTMTPQTLSPVVYDQLTAIANATFPDDRALRDRLRSLMLGACVLAFEEGKLAAVAEVREVLTAQHPGGVLQ